MSTAGGPSTVSRERELEELKERVRRIEEELAASQHVVPWRATQYYTAYYATTGFMLGAIAATSSLLFNVIGASLFGKHPLELIRVYLTFPMGAQALNYDTVDNGLILAAGCCLYLATGMLYGVLFQIVLSRFAAGWSWPARFILASALALGIWLFNFYGVLSWLQPLLLGGNWIVEQTPWWVAATTHLVFGWTMLLIYPLGTYTPYRPVSEQS